jgi:hypothetical protein
LECFCCPSIVRFRPNAPKKKKKKKDLYKPRVNAVHELIKYGLGIQPQKEDNNSDVDSACLLIMM